MADKTMFSVTGRLINNPPFDKPFETKNGKRVSIKKFVVEVNDDESFAFTAMMGGEVLENAQKNKELPHWFKALQDSPIGTTVQVDFGIRTSSKDGKYYTELFCNKVTAIGDSPALSSPSKGAVPATTEFDDLPF